MKVDASIVFGESALSMTVAVIVTRQSLRVRMRELWVDMLIHGQMRMSESVVIFSRQL